MPFNRRALTLMMAFLPGLIFAIGVESVIRWNTPLWPHQLYFWLLGAAICGPLLATLLVGRWVWSLGFVAVFMAALTLGALLQLGVNSDMWASCPGTKTSNGWGMDVKVNAVRGEATCIYIDPTSHREMDRNGFTLFDRLEDVFG